MGDTKEQTEQSETGQNSQTDENTVKRRNVKKPKNRVQQLKETLHTQEICDNFKMLVGSIKQVPKFMMDNEDIHTGYRIGFNSKWELFKSLFMIHNESVNVWSHLAGVFFFVVMIIYVTMNYSGIKSIQHEMYFKMIEEFDYISSLAGGVYNCDYDEIHNATNELLEEYSMDIGNLSDHSEIQGKFYEQLEQNFTENHQDVNDMSTRLDFHDKLAKMLEKIEAYFYSMAMGISKIGQNIRCPEKVMQLIEKAKNATSSLQENFKNFTEKIDFNDLDFDHMKRMISIDNLSQKFSDIFQKIDQNGDGFPDVSFSSYFDSLEGMLHDVTKIPLYVHIVSAILCLSCSVIFHLFWCHSQTTCQILARLDYGGISFLIAGSSVPPIYYTLYCDQWATLRTVYLSVEFIACVAVFIVTIAPQFDKPSYRGIRAILFVTFGTCSAFPLIQFLVWNEPQTMIEFPIFCWALGGAIYIIGAFIYSVRFPESFFPGKFDLLGHSHNIWHFFVLTAAFVHYYGSVELYHLRRQFNCPA